MRYIDKLPDPKGEAAVLGTFVHEILEDLLNLDSAERSLATAKKIAGRVWEETAIDEDFISLCLAEDEVKAFCGAALREVGPPRLLLNNAALIHEPAPLWEIESDEFGQVIDVNIKGVANVLRHAVPIMIDQNKGVIVNFSSGWGRSTSPEVAPYCATKWAIEGMTQALSSELPENLAAVAFNPGVIDTDMLRTVWGEGASECPDPQQWAESALPILEKLDAGDNGRSLSV